jgi:chromosome segregation ATPase
MIFLRHLVFLEKSMARLSDSALPSQLELMSPTVLMAQPSDSPVEDESALEGLLYPIVIIKREGDICFMNGAARRLLSEGLDLRLAAFVRGHQQGMGPTTQVHFKLQNGQDLILKVGLGEIVWLGEKAIQVSIWNVTPYLAIIQKLRKERARSLAASLEQTRQQADEEASQRQQAQADLEKARAAASASEQIQSKLRQELEALRRDREQLSADREGESSQVTELLEKNARLNQDLADRAARENELAQAREQLQVGAEVREKLSARIETLESELSDATAQREELQRQVAQQVSGDASARDEIKAEIAKRQSLEKEIATLRQDLAGSEQARSESAQTFETLKNEIRSHADALALAREELAGVAELAKVQQDKAAKAEADAASLAHELQRVKSESAKTIETLKGGSASRSDALALAREELAEAARLAEVQQDKAAKAEADAAFIMKTEAAKRESLEKVITALRQDLASSEQARSESAETFETVKNETRSHADALARAREELAEAARLAKVQQDKAAKAEADAAFIMKTEAAKRQSLEKEIATLRHDLASSEQARSESAQTFETLKNEIRSHADALARTREELAEAARLAKAQQEKAAKAEADAASLAHELQRVKSESAKTIETLRGESASHADALARARGELAEAARLAKVQQDKAAKAEADAAFIMKTEAAKRESLEKVITGLRQDLASSEQARSESAETFETLKNETRSRADALARTREELAEAARLAKAQQEKAAKAEVDAVSLAHELQKVKSESANTIEMLKGESASHADALARAREELTQAVMLAKVQQEKAARAEAEVASIARQLRQAKSEAAERIETLEGKGRGASDALALAREELAEVAQLAKVQRGKVAKAEADAVSLAHELQKVKSESANTIEMLKGESASHADALARAREELTQAVMLAKVQQEKAARAEAEVASIARQLRQAKSEAAERIETLEGKGRGASDALALAREELAEVAQLAKVQRGKVAKAEADAVSLAHELQKVKSESANTIEMLKGESASHADALARAREELTQAVILAKVQQEKAARAEAEAASITRHLRQAKSEAAERIETLEGKGRGASDALALAREELAGAATLAKVQQGKAAKAETDAASLAHELQRVKSESAQTFETLKNEIRSHADALARTREELAEAAKLAKAQQDKAAKAEADAASLAHELQRVKSESANTIETLKGESASHADALARAREELTQAVMLARVQQEKAARAEAEAASIASQLRQAKSEAAERIETLEGKVRGASDALALAREELAGAARLAKVQQDKVAKAEADAASLAHELQRVRSESAQTIETLNGGSASRADALARTCEELVEAARFAKAQQDKAAEAEKQAASAAREPELEVSNSAIARRAWELEKAE